MADLDTSQGHPCYDNGDNVVTSVFPYTQAEARFMVAARMLSADKFIAVDDDPRRPPQYEIRIRQDWGHLLAELASDTFKVLGDSEADEVTLSATDRFDSNVAASVSAVVASPHLFWMIDKPFEDIAAEHPNLSRLWERLRDAPP